MKETQNELDPEEVIRGLLRARGLRARTGAYAEAREQSLRWLDQFEVSERPYMVELIKSIRIESDVAFRRTIAKLAKAIIKSLGNRHAEAAFVGIGSSPGSSGSHFLYPLLGQLRLDESYAKTIGEVPELVAKGIALVFVDDIVGSGNQATRFSKNYLPAQASNTVYACLYGLDTGIERIEREGRFGSVIVSTRLTDKDRAFSPNSQVFPDPRIRRVIKKIAKKHGGRIFPTGPLGYDDSELVISFPHNTPNNTLPIIWGGVESESKANDWEPLIERRKAAKPVSPSIATGGVMLNRSAGYRLSVKPDFYERVQPFDSAEIKEIFVEPRYKIEIYADSGVQHAAANGFTQDAKLLLSKPAKILVLASPYGCGKTFLSRYLDLMGVLGDSRRTAFISAISLKRALVNGANYKLIFGDITACIIDAVDELVVDDQDAEQNLAEFCHCLTAARALGVLVVVNIRVSEANRLENRVINSIFQHLYAYGEDFRLPVLRLQGFEKKQVVDWLSRYQSGLSDDPLTHGGIEIIHKRLGYAAQNPLFLYQLTSFYRHRDRNIDGIYSIYQIYDLFVDSTTTGRFEPIRAAIGPRVWRFASLYSGFLEQVACTINNSRSFRAGVRFDREAELDWRLDANDRTYTITERELNSVIDAGHSAFLVGGSGVHATEDRRLELLNNYFFIRNSDLIGFKDNNILFFLVAKRLFRAISGLMRSGDDYLSENLATIANTKCHPQAIEILLKRIQVEGEDFRSALSRRIDELIRENRIIQLTSESLERLTGGAINRDIVLGIVLLHVKRGSYDNLGYFMTRLSWLTSAVKFQDSIYGTLVARFFRNIQLNGVEFRRLNCDDYNFKGTRFNGVSFIQCKLFEPVFDDTFHVGTKFTLCDFGGHKEVSRFVGVAGSIVFDQCHLGRVVVALGSESVSLTFKRCEVGELHIESSSNSATVKLDLSVVGSTVSKIFFVNTYLGICEIVHSTVESLSDKNSRGEIRYSFARPSEQIRWGKETGRIRIIDRD